MQHALACALLALSGPSLAYQDVAQSAEVAWGTDLQEALRVADRDQRPLLAVFR